MSVHQDERNSKRWIVVYKGKKYRIDPESREHFMSKTAAKNFEKKLSLQLKTNPQVKKVYFHEAIEDYLKLMKEDSSYSTYLKCRIAMNKVVIPNTENKVIDSITANDVRKFRTWLAESEYSTYYKNYIVNKYKAVFRHSREYFGLKNDPTEFMKTFKKTYEEQKRYREKENEIWTPEEFEQFIVCVRNPVHKALFMTLFFTGARIGEAMALQWKDITDDRMIHITKSVSRKTENSEYEIKETKTRNSTRVISAGDNLYEYLMDFKAEEKKIPGFRESWYCFGRQRPLSQSPIDRSKAMAIKEAGVKYITIHEMRHSHASWLINNGVNIVAVSRRLGHSDVSMTLEVYTHLFKKTNKELTEFIDDNSSDLFKKKN